MCELESFRGDCIVGRRKRRETLVLEEKSNSRWVRAKWGASDVTGRGREGAGQNRLKLLQHLLVSSLKAYKRVLFEEATTLWETLDQDYTEPIHLSRDFKGLLTELVRSIFKISEIRISCHYSVCCYLTWLSEILSFNMLLAVKSSVRSTLWSYRSCVCYSSSTWWEAFINIPGKSSPPHADSSLILYFPCPELRAMAELWNKDLKGQFSWMADVLAMLFITNLFSVLSL